MKIGIDARPLIAAPTGIGVYLDHALAALDNIDGEHRYWLISSDAVHAGVQGPRWRIISGGLPKPFVGSLWMQGLAPVWARRLRLDLFWGTRHHLPLGLPAGVGCLLTIHDVVHRCHPQTMSIANLVLERVLMGLSLRRADRVLADSRATADDLERYYPFARRKVRVAYPGLPGGSAVTAPPPPMAGLPERFLLFVGTLEPRKNFVRLLKAYLRGDPRGHGVHLVVAGGQGWGTTDAIRAMTSPAARDFVHRLGYLSRAELFGLYRRALGVVFPSLYEGFGFPVLEAMACGVPVITSRVSSMPETAGDAALLVDPYDLDSIAQALERLIREPDLRRELIRRGRLRCRLFDWRAYAAALLAVFTELAPRPRR
jgi:glycosyltransferase involved in cell wall biosynthesis